jgi:hypothetical protein
MCHAVRRQMGDVAALKDNLTASRWKDAAEQVEQGRFTGPVGADDGMQRTGLDLDTDIIHGHQPAKFFAKVLRFEENIHPGPQEADIVVNIGDCRQYSLRNWHGDLD